MSTKIGFNNFKAFGSQMQYFTKKPITLVYGPNSVGKSSFLHSQLLLTYFRNHNTNFNIYETNFAGDEIDFGGFENFIHKHDTTKSISFEVIFTDHSDFNRLLTPKYSEIVKLQNNGFFDCELTSDEINLKLESEYENSGIKLQHLVSYISTWKEKHRAESYDENQELAELLNEIKTGHSKVAFCEYHRSNGIESPTGEDCDNFIRLFNSQIEKLESSDNIIIKAILLTEHDKADDIVSRLKFYKYLSTIHTIKFSIEINSKASMLLSINNVQLVGIQNIDNFLHKTEYASINEEHEALQEYKKITREDCPLNLFKDFFHQYNDFDFSLNNLIGEFFYLKKSVNQYFGPLRHYPERFELYNIEDLGEKEDSLFTKFSVLMMKSRTNILLFIGLMLITLLAYRIFISEKLFYEADVNGLVFAIPFLFIVVSGIYAILNKNDFGKEILNSFLPKRYGLLRDSVISSYDAWKTLSKSSDTVNKLNIWLGDSSKLKSNYSIKVVKKPITYLGILERRIAKILGAENARWLYYSSLENNKITKFITNYWSHIERKLNIQQRYESQVVFTDLAKNTEVTPRDMGLGISQILPILISTFSSKETTLYLEQPELHLHPKLQMEIADEFIRSAKEQNNEFMIETHSEHMLLRIMKRMRQTADGTLEDESLRLTPDDVCLLYVDNDGEKTYIRELRLSKNGKLLDHWPNGFFEEGYKERFL